MDGTKSLRDVLSNKEIVEYPTIYVVLPSNQNLFPEASPEEIAEHIPKFQTEQPLNKKRKYGNNRHNNSRQNQSQESSGTVENSAMAEEGLIEEEPEEPQMTEYAAPVTTPAVELTEEQLVESILRDTQSLLNNNTSL